MFETTNVSQKEEKTKKKIRNAIEHYFKTDDGLKKTACQFNIKRTTLQGYVKKLKSTPDRDTKEIQIGYSRSAQFFFCFRHYACI